MDSKPLVSIGSARKAHGLKGHALAHLGAGDQTHLQAGSHVVLRPLAGSGLNGEQTFVVESIQFGNDIRIKFEGVPDRTALELLLPFEILVSADDLPELSEGEYYVEDLLGLKVLDEAGVQWGVIEDFYETPAHTVFVIRPRHGALVEIPYVPAFFKTVNLEEDVAVIVVPEEVE
jgi:16S rRNA processing protein RimM